MDRATVSLATGADGRPTQGRGAAASRFLQIAAKQAALAVPAMQVCMQPAD